MTRRKGLIRLRFSLYGMYEYDNTILDDIVLPETINKQVLVDRILQDWGGYNCRFSNPDMCKRFIHSWFSANEYNFEMIQKALTMEYNPIENYDRTETYETTRTGEMSETEQSTNKNQAIASTENNYTLTENAENKNSEVPFDANSEKETSKNDTNRNTNQTNDGTSNETQTLDANSDRERNNTENEKHSSHIHGNIGVTTNQQMIESELALREYDIYQNISNRFANQFVYLVS